MANSAPQVADLLGGLVCFMMGAAAGSWQTVRLKWLICWGAFVRFMMGRRRALGKLCASSGWFLLGPCRLYDGAAAPSWQTLCLKWLVFVGALSAL